MNAIKRFLIKKFFKMDKFQLLLLVANHYNSLELKGKDIERANAVNWEVDRLTDELIKDFPKPVAEKLDKVDKAFVPPPATTKVDSTLKTEGVVKPPVVVIKKKDENPPEEVTVMVRPYYDCAILQEKVKEPKKVKFDDCGIKLPAFKDEVSMKQFNNVFPTVEMLDLALDEAWDMATKGLANSAINAKLKELIGSYYVNHGLKSNDDYYKISNAYSKLVKILRRGFGEGYEDRRVSVTRPSFTALEEMKGEIVFSKDKDCFIEEPEIPNVAESKFDKADKAKNDKPELKKVQEQTKAAEEKKEPENVDEEQQETDSDNTPETEENPKAEVEEPEVNEPDETEEGKAPAVNEFDAFNDIETLIFEKLKAGNLKASKEKNPSVQSAVKAEAREDAKLLIQSRFGDEEWALKDDKGFWKTEFLKYWNAIVKEIGTRANVK
jgi:hypothetical protein